MKTRKQNFMIPTTIYSAASMNVVFNIVTSEKRIVMFVKTNVNSFVNKDSSENT